MSQVMRTTAVRHTVLGLVLSCLAASSIAAANAGDFDGPGNNRYHTARPLSAMEFAAFFTSDELTNMGTRLFTAFECATKVPSINRLVGLRRHRSMGIGARRLIRVITIIRVHVPRSARLITIRPLGRTSEAASVGGLFNFNQECDVHYWHKADITVGTENVRFWG